jgi:hypothetical protein
MRSHDHSLGDPLMQSEFLDSDGTGLITGGGELAQALHQGHDPNLVCDLLRIRGQRRGRMSVWSCSSGNRNSALTYRRNCERRNRQQQATNPEVHMSVPPMISPGWFGGAFAQRA